MTNFPDTVQVTLRLRTKGSGEKGLEVQLRNNLPHDLPTGTFGRKVMRLVLVSGPQRQVVRGSEVLVANEGNALRSGSKQTLFLSLPKDALTDALRLQLIRTSPDDPDRQPITLASIPVPPAQEASSE